MPITNSKVNFMGIDLQVSPGGITAHKIQVVDDFMPWVSRQAILGVRQSDDSLGFDVTMLTGKRVHVTYGVAAGTNVIQQNNDNVLDQLYRKVVQTSFDVSGTGLSMADASTIFAKYKVHQEAWGKRARNLASVQDPDITKDKRAAIITTLTGLTWPVGPLTIMGTNYDVIFGEGMTCQFTNWVVGNYTDFSFNLVQREPLI